MKVRITSSDRMYNKSYHLCGKPTWWARIGSGRDAVWVDIGRVRGDEYLDVEAEIPDGTREIMIGCGPAGRHGVRERIIVDASAATTNHAIAPKQECVVMDNYVRAQQMLSH